jgi:SAM-dependent methyltransferase
MNESLASDAGNADQIRYWNSSMGMKWVNYQRELDACFSAVNNRLFEHAKIVPGETALDIGCGAADLTLEISTHVGSAGHVTAVDISRVLLDFAIERARKLDRENIEFILADAQNHIFEPGRFDLILSRFGVMFFNDPVAAFRNLKDALQPGGRIVFACWADVELNPWFQIPKLAAIRQLGQPAITDPRAPGPMAFSEQDYVKDILTEAGLENIAIQEEVIPLVNQGSLDEVANLACNLGAATRIMKELEGSEEDFQVIKSEVTKAFAGFCNGDEIRVPATLNFVSCDLNQGA